MNPIDIGDRLELFLDRHLLAELRDVSLRLHEPTPREVALSFDQPWDGPFAGALSIVKDGGEYRLYYAGFPRWMAKTLRCNCVAIRGGPRGQLLRKPGKMIGHDTTARGVVRLRIGSGAMSVQS